MSEVVEILQPLFQEKILKANLLITGYDNTNHVYSVTTEKNVVIFKVLKDLDADKSTVFWKGLNLLFGATFEDSIKSQKNISEYLNHLNVIPVPKLLKADYTSDNPLHKPYVILERMEGESLVKGSELEQNFMQDADVAYKLGEFLTKIHADKYDFFGNMAKTRYPLSDFPKHLFNTMKTLASTPKASQDKLVQEMLPFFLRQAENLKPPTAMGMIMLDLWPSQFLSSNGNISALIDIESYVIGPIELELVLLELWLTRLDKFKEAYLESGVLWPDFEETRELYRFFLFLLYDCPEAGLKACLDSAAKFAQGDRVKGRVAIPHPRPGGYPGIY